MKFCLVGGFAVTFRAEPRLTRDIDIALIANGDQHVENIIQSLTQLGWVAEILLENKARGLISTVRMIDPNSARKIYTDLLFHACGIEKEVVESATLELLFPDTRKLPVASVPSLIAMKCLSHSPQHRSKDWDDLRGLVSRSSETQREEAARMVRLIEERGFARGVNLVAKLEDIFNAMK